MNTKVRDWILAIEGKLNYSDVLKLTGEAYIRGLFLCSLYKRNPYVGGHNILNVFSKEIERYIIVSLYPEVRKMPVIEGFGEIGDFSVNMAVLITENAIWNLFKSFTGRGRKSEYVDDMNLFKTYLQINKSENCDDKTIHREINSFREICFLREILHRKEFLSENEIGMDVKKVIDYGHPGLLKYVPEMYRNLDYVIEEVILTAEPEEKRYLIDAFESAWNVKVKIPIDNLVDAIKLQDQQKRHSLVVPLSVRPEVLFEMVKEQGAEETLKFVLDKAKSNKINYINDVFPVSQNPVWMVPSELIHEVQSNCGGYFALTDDDMSNGINPFTRLPVASNGLPPKKKGPEQTYSEIWSNFLERPM